MECLRIDKTELEAARERLNVRRQLYARRVVVDYDGGLVKLSDAAYVQHTTE